MQICFKYYIIEEIARYICTLLVWSLVVLWWQLMRPCLCIWH